MIIHLMPSEIARLVLGYLRETDCKETAKTFVKESKHLTEYANGLKNGINYSTNIGGQSLLDIINSYCCHQNKSNVKTNEKSNERKNNEELNRLSKQLTKIETLLNKLMQNSMNGQIINQNSYRLIGSPPIMSTSSPLLINTIGLNSLPIVSNNSSKFNENELIVPNTPSRSDYNSPRRKRTPRRRVLSGSSPLRSVANTSFEDSSDLTLVNTSSDQLRDESEPQLKIDMNEPLVQPEFIVEELINFEPLHDVLANNINRLFINTNTLDPNSEQNKEPNNVNEVNDQNVDPIEIRINDEMVHNILSSLETAPEYNTILDIITEKELQMTPYKNLSSVETTTSSSASSLNTPQTPQIRVNSQKTYDSCNQVVKNLMPELKTPEKTVTLYAARSPSEARITPVKVTPVKVFRTDLTQDLNFILNDKNVPIIVPKVSLVGPDYEMISNSIANSATTYSVSMHSNITTNQQFVNSGVPPIRKIYPKGMGKNVNFHKASAELQVKRTDLNPRKILPKPTNSGRMSTTTITPVYSDAAIESVPKQSMILINNSNISETNRQNDSKSYPISPKRLKEKSAKRPNSSDNEVTPPHKIQASDQRFPTVNILRKMNVNKMDQFLKQIHSNKTND